MEFRESKTRENLMRAFAGESQARNRYTYAAEAARSAGLHWIEHVFDWTPKQEKEHAELFLKQLAQCEGENVHIEATYPVVNTAWTLDRLLRAAQHDEYEEARNIYPAFARTAKEEGFVQVANLFDMVAAIEQTHGDRFGQLAQRAEQNKLFSCEGETVWVCLNCGHVHIGREAPQVCPVCKHAQGFFVRVETGEILVQEG